MGDKAQKPTDHRVVIKGFLRVCLSFSSSLSISLRGPIIVIAITREPQPERPRPETLDGDQFNPPHAPPNQTPRHGAVMEKW